MEIVNLKHSNLFANNYNMKILYLALVVTSLTACHAYMGNSSYYNPIIGTWEQPNVTLSFKGNGKYNYEYFDAGYKYEQSGKYRYFSDCDSIVLYNYYPDAYTKGSKNEYWSIRKITSDSLVVVPPRITVLHNKDTQDSEIEPVEIYTRRK